MFHEPNFVHKAIVWYNWTACTSVQVQHPDYFWTFAILRVTNTLLVLMQYVDTLVALLIWLCIAPLVVLFILWHCSYCMLLHCSHCGMVYFKIWLILWHCSFRGIARFVSLIVLWNCSFFGLFCNVVFLILWHWSFCGITSLMVLL